MNGAAADEWKSGNEGSRGALVSAAERVEPEVNLAPAIPWNNNTNTTKCTHTNTHTCSADCFFHSLGNSCYLNNPLVIKTNLVQSRRFLMPSLWTDWGFEFSPVCSRNNVRESANMLCILIAFLISDETSLNARAVLGSLVGAVSLWMPAALWNLGRMWQVSAASKLHL